MKKNFLLQKKYNYFLIFLSFFFLLVISLININLDNTKVYPEKIKFLKNEIDLNQIIKKLILEKGILLFNNEHWSERELAEKMSTYYKNSDCLILGSSQIKTLSVNQTPKTLVKNCKNPLNLGVSGGTIEDYFAILNNINRDELKNKKILFSIHPYTLNFNRDARWLYYSSNFQEFLKKLKFSDNKIENIENLRNKNLIKLIKNLLNFEYLKKSISLILKKKNQVLVVKNSDTNIKNFEFNMLFDGSIIKDINSSNKNIIINKNYINYKIINERWYDELVFELILKLKIYLAPENKIIFLLTPYHNDVWSFKEEPIVEAMRLVENRIHKFAKENEINIIGSFDPKNLNCENNEFYDALHASNKCLSKLENYEFKYNKQ